MKYEVIMEAKNYALIKRGIDLEEYAVVSRLDRETESWAHTCVYYNFSPFSNLTQAEALALEVNECYIDGYSMFDVYSYELTDIMESIKEFMEEFRYKVKFEKE